MGKKNKKYAFELSFFGAIGLAIVYLVGYYLIKGTYPECSLNFNIVFPLTLLAFGGIGGNIKAIMNKFKI